MKQRLLMGLLSLFWGLIFTSSLIAQEHPGKALSKRADVTPDQVKKAILDYVRWDSNLKGGYFLIWDENEQQVWKLRFSRPHGGVRVVEGEKYFLCTDFKAESKQPDGSISTTLFDLDFWVKQDEDDKLRVDQIKIHKVAGIPRFRYKNDEMKPLE